MSHMLDMTNKQETYKKLLAAARLAVKNSYSPYSHFPVGAAILAKDGRVFSGCNIEIATWAGSICAERVAIAKAVSEGAREFEAVAVYCAKQPGAWPCGICRQFLAEFGTHIECVTEKADGSSAVLKLGELLPHTFGPENSEFFK